MSFASLVVVSVVASVVEMRMSPADVCCVSVVVSVVASVVET